MKYLAHLDVLLLSSVTLGAEKFVDSSSFLLSRGYVVNTPRGVKMRRRRILTSSFPDPSQMYGESLGPSIFTSKELYSIIAQKGAA